MKVTVIGRSPAWQDADGACSGYLVETDTTRVLVDCGNGVFGKLRGRIDHRELDAVVISHPHGDHILDLIPFAYALLYGPQKAGDRVRLHLPPGGAGVLRTICGAFDSPTLMDDAFDVDHYDPESGIQVGDINFTMTEVPHFIPAYAMAISSDGCGRFVYGADCGVSDSLVDLAKGADILMVEATLPVNHEGPDGVESGHLTPVQAGLMARDAGAGRLVLTHASDCLDLEGSRLAAAEVFGGAVDVAREGLSWDL
ncbi:MAG: MBL fold metallo-hydrolase [Solirubrobacterales bacterium]|nr:MBL fold metallo-hydrolase [Solirubrobacterales bacterium]